MDAGKISDHFHRDSTGREDIDADAAAEERAALLIQRAWRRRKRDKYLGSDFLWTDLSVNARMKLGREAAAEGKNDVRERWRRAVFFASRLQDGNIMLASSGAQHIDAARKHLETQHWLELIDGKHRYGSNLKYYHKQWMQEDTTENFFKWLDEGGGKNLSLDQCPREQLERERITYLSPKQRLNYLVEIDSEGKLRWAVNGQLVDTSAGHWKDSYGDGIVPLEDDAPPAPVGELQHHVHDLSPQPSLAEVEDAAMHYAGIDPTKPPIQKAWKKNFTLHGMFEKLLRKTIKRNTWIYVSDKNFNIFIGIKNPGTFQHSSFLAGGLVTSAGLISVKEGLIHTLSPLSGHYRTTIQHFRRFLSVLEERGVDMDRVEISKAETALWGIEHLAKLKKKQAAVLKAGENGVERAADAISDSVVHQIPSQAKHLKEKIFNGFRHTPQSADDAPSKKTNSALSEDVISH